MTVFCILLAAPRSGTTMLGDAVSRAFKAAWPQEIFHSEHAGPEMDFRASPDIKIRCNFFNFRHELLKGRPALSFPSIENQSEIFKLYVKYISESEEPDRFLLDVKYSSWHHLNYYWWRPGQVPNLLTSVMKLRFPLVHLKRRNLFALYCSQKRAEQTGLWSTLEETAEIGEKLVINASECAASLRSLRETELMFDRWVSGNSHDLYYEDIMTNGTFSDEVTTTFIDVYGAEPTAPLTTVYRKVTPPLRDVVANPDEVLSALCGTEFHHMAEQALA